MDKRYLGFLPVPALIAVTAALYYAVESSRHYDPAWLIQLANTLFITLIFFTVAYFAISNYLTTGRVQILLIGYGVLIFGLGAAISGFVRGIPDGANLHVTIYNTGALMGGLFHFIAALILLADISSEPASRRRKTWLVAGYPGVIIFMALLTMACLRGIMPPFFIQDVGPTPLGRGILGTADILFIFSFIIFIGMYSRNKEVFLYWYALALALTAISLTAFLIQRSVGSPVGWAGRVSQYVGGAYFLVALITAAGSARSRKTSLANVLTASLCSSEEQFRALAEHSPDVICRFDRELKHIYLNQAGLRMLGKPAAAIIGKTIEEAGAPEPYSSLWKERIQKIFETGRQLDVEYYFPTPDGPRFYQSRCVPEYGVDGTVNCVLVVSHDITGRKLAEESLRESEERYRLLAETMSQGVIHQDAYGRIISMNPAAERILGKSGEQFLGTSPVQEEHYAIRENGERFPDMEHPSIAVLQTGVAVRGVIMGVFNPILGGYRWISIDAVPGFHPGETCPSEVNTVFEDITERKLAEEQIKFLNEQLNLQVAELNIANKELEAFGYSVSHDLRAPLRHISGFVKLLKQRLIDLRDEKARDYADLISTASKKMSTLVDDLLNFSRLGRSEMHTIKVNMNDLVKGIVQEFQVALKERRIRWEIDELPDVFCDRSLLRLAIVNLVSNAVKFTSLRPEAEIRIECKDEEDKFIFSVRDNGVGFDMKSSDRLFGVFHRLHTQEEFEGTGIGLANVQRIISRHGGSVWAEGVVGHGATFYFTIPKTEGNMDMPENMAQTEPAQ